MAINNPHRCLYKKACRRYKTLAMNQDNSIYLVTLIKIAIRQERRQCGATKKLWGSPAEQTRDIMLAVKVEKKPQCLKCR